MSTSYRKNSLQRKRDGLVLRKVSCRRKTISENNNTKGSDHKNLSVPNSLQKGAFSSNLKLVVTPTERWWEKEERRWRQKARDRPSER